MTTLVGVDQTRAQLCWFENLADGSRSTTLDTIDDIANIQLAQL